MNVAEITNHRIGNEVGRRDWPVRPRTDFRPRGPLENVPAPRPVVAPGEWDSAA